MLPQARRFHCLILITCLALLGACGGSSNGTGTDDSFVDTDGPFTVEVFNGYGSGVYAAGETVHVWSAVSTSNEVALTWTGDASLLA